MVIGDKDWKIITQFNSVIKLNAEFSHFSFLVFMSLVNSKIKTILKNYHRMIEQNRQMNEKIQNCTELIRETSVAIVALKNKIKKLKTEYETEKSRSNTSKNDEVSSNSMVSTNQSPILSIAKFCFWSIFLAHTLIPLFK